MLTIQLDPTIVLDLGRSIGVWAIVFQPDGKHLLGGDSYGTRRWRVEDGQVVGEQMEVDLYAIAVSRDHQWVVCGTDYGASVWDAGIQEKVTEVEGDSRVYTVDVSPDSTRFATGTPNEASIWSISSGERLIGPLQHDNTGAIGGIKFSPNGERIATACGGGCICIFDSHHGDKLITITTITTGGFPSTPLAWSNDGKKIFATSKDNKIKSFDVSTGSQLAESQFLGDYSVYSIALASSGNFIVSCQLHSIAFLDSSTLSHIHPVIEESGELLRSIALSPDNGYLACGLGNGKITVHNLGDILPDVYGPFHVSICALAMLAYRTSNIPSLMLTHCIRHLTRKDNQTSSL